MNHDTVPYIIMSLFLEDCDILGVMAKILESGSRGDLGASNTAVRQLKEVMGRTDQAFLGSDMQDATEFLGLLLTEIKESLEKEGRTEGNIIQSTFSFEMEELLVCSNCGDENRKVKQDLSLWCDVNRLAQNSNIW